MPREPLPSEAPIANPLEPPVSGSVLAGPGPIHHRRDAGGGGRLAGGRLAGGRPAGGRPAGGRLAGGSALTRQPKPVAAPRFDGDDPGPPELRQHVEVEIVRLVEDGTVQQVRRTVDLLAAMQRNGTITGDMAVAGRRFQSSFQAGHIMAGGQSSFLRLPTGQRHWFCRL